MPCRTCGVPGTQHCAACRGTTKDRGYSGEHQRRRRADQRVMDQQGYLVCWRCGEPIIQGEPWDEGHDDEDRTVWRGPEHANRCNRKAASAKAHGRGVG